MPAVKRKLSTVLALTALPIALFVFAGTANAAPTFDTSLAPPGVYFGTGNTNAHFTTNTALNIELGLGTVERFVTPITPDANSSVYHVQTGTTSVPGKTGADWDFVYSINTNVNGSDGGLTLDGITSSLCVQDVGQGTNSCFNPLSIPDNAHDGNSPSTTAQNAEALQFDGLDTRFFDPSFDINANDTYIFTLNVLSQDNVLLDSVQMTDVAGSGATSQVPEPFSLSILGAGLVGLGTLRRRKDKKGCAATL